MKNLLLLSLGLVSFLNYAMEENQGALHMPYRPSTKQVQQLVCQVRGVPYDANDKTSWTEAELVKVNELLQNGRAMEDVERAQLVINDIVKAIDVNKPLLEQLRGLEGNTRKEAIKFWCDTFKSNLKKIEKDNSCSMWNTDNFAFYIDQNNVFRGEKHLKSNNDQELNNLNHTDNVEFRDTFAMLNCTKRIMNEELQSVSWFEWLWNYSAYKNYQKSIQTLDDEIALFKDQDRVVSPKKTVLYGSKVKIEDTETEDGHWNIHCEKYMGGKLIIKPQLTHRDVFTRSRMSQYYFEQVKAARE